MMSWQFSTSTTCSSEWSCSTCYVQSRKVSLILLFHCYVFLLYKMSISYPSSFNCLSSFKAQIILFSLGNIFELFLTESVPTINIYHWPTTSHCLLFFSYGLWQGLSLAPSCAWSLMQWLEFEKELKCVCGINEKRITPGSWSQFFHTGYLQ